METGTQRFVTIVVVILVVLAGMASVLYLSREPIESNGPDPEDKGWSEDDDGYYIYGEANWSGWDQRLDKGVFIHFGGSLDIVDSRLAIPLEHLVFGTDPFISVNDWSTLNIERSDVVIESSPELERAWVITRIYHNEVPYMWRVVNLQGATAPVLEFDLKLWNTSPVVAVAIQATPEADLEVLATFGSQEVDVGEWAHIEVPLHDHIGTTPRIVLFIANAQDYSVLISGLRVVDGEGPLIGDRFTHSDPRKDGWSFYSFSSFLEILDTYADPLTTLIKSNGDIRIVDSNIESLSGLSRKNDEYYANRLAPRPWMNTALITAASSGGDINVTDGSLTIIDSNVSYVPLIAIDSSVSVMGSTFVGDNEMMTVFECEGVVRDCSFTSEPGTVDRGLDWVDDILWQLAVEESTHGVEVIVEGCTFKGTGPGSEGYGLHLNNVISAPRDCTFSDLELGFWSHKCQWEIGWDELKADLTFEGEFDYWYLETRDVRLAYQGSSKPSGVGYRGYWTPAYFIDGPRIPVDQDAYETEIDILLVAPVLSESPSEGVVEYYHLNVVVTPDWAHRKIVTFDPHVAHHDVGFLPGERDESWYGAFFDLMFEQGDPVGQVEMDVSALVDRYRYYDPRLELYLDGAFVTVVDVSIEAYYDSYLYVNGTFNLSVPVGLHEASIRLVETNLSIGPRDTTDIHNVTILRLSEVQAAYDFSALLDNDVALLVLDPGVDQEGVRLQYPETDSWSGSVLNVVLWEGSRVVLEELHTVGYSELTVYAFGDGEVGIRDVNCYWFTYYTNGTRTVFDGDWEGGHFLYGLSSTFRWSGSTYRGMLYLHMYDGSTLEMNNCRFVAADAVGILLDNSTAGIKDCEFATLAGTHSVLVRTLGNSSLDLVGCTFSGIPLDLENMDSNTSWNVSGCTFEEEGAFLVLVGSLPEDVVWETYEDLILPHGRIEGNLFRGEGTGMVLDPLAGDGLLGNNTFSDGAQALAFYTPNITLGNWSTTMYRYRAMTHPAWDFKEMDIFTHQGDWWRWFMYLVDVTEDPLDLADIGHVPLIIHDMDVFGNSAGVVIMFTSAPLNEIVAPIKIPNWPKLHGALRELSAEITQGGDWWSESDV